MLDHRARGAFCLRDLDAILVIAGLQTLVAGGGEGGGLGLGRATVLLQERDAPEIVLFGQVGLASEEVVLAALLAGARLLLQGSAPLGELGQALFMGFFELRGLQ
ncbi:MAG: hypothetical protein A2V88_12715 [Elusimicrobia bacterium RBG_16_66_12]|nr:MAG: hypothetical protein A2V88_12715 [Elusimicrobia bacterium RBG_16_66_12]